MIIGVDIDGVLAEFVQAFAEYYNSKHGTKVSKEHFFSYNFWEVLGGTRESAVREVMQFYETAYFRGIQPIRGSQEGVAALSQHQLVVITSRPHVVHDETKKWVERHFPQMFKGIYLTNEWSEAGKSQMKPDVCLELGVDVMIEDSLEYAVQCAGKGLMVLLLNQPWNRASELPERVAIAHSWRDISRYLKT